MENISERVSQIFKVCAVNLLQAEESNVRQLPPSVVDVEGNRGAFPLGIGHAVDYVSHRAVLIGYFLICLHGFIDNYYFIYCNLE